MKTSPRTSRKVIDEGQEPERRPQHQGAFLFATAAAATEKIRDVDFKRERDGMEGKIAAIEYDPHRSSRIALVHYTDGVKTYI